MIDLAAKPFYLKPEDIEWVNKTLAGMTTEEKAGQLFCVLFKECKPEEFEYVFNILKPGGCMYRVVPTERAIASASPATISVNPVEIHIPPTIPSRWFSHA